MASIRKRNGRWQVIARDGYGRDAKQKSLGTFERKTDAQRLLRKTEADLDRGVFVDPTLGRVSLVATMEAHIERTPMKYNTRRNADYALGQVKAHFGTASLARVLPSDVQAFVTGLDLEPRTVASIFRFLRATLREAYHDELIGRDPSARVKLPRHTGGEVSVPSVEGVSMLIAAAPADFAIAITLGAGLGLRSSEACGLSVDRIDFLRREVSVDRQWHGRLDRFEPPKSDSSIRTIPASDVVLERLARHVELHGTGEHGLLLNAAGRPLNSNRHAWRWEQTTTAAGIAPRFHDLRHHYASSLLSAGCSIVAVQRALGHSSASISLDIYGHLMPSDNDRIRGAIDSAWNARDDMGTTSTTREAL